jgi:hypothetical protein
MGITFLGIVFRRFEESDKGCDAVRSGAALAAVILFSVDGTAGACSESIGSFSVSAHAAHNMLRRITEAKSLDRIISVS